LADTFYCVKWDSTIHIRQELKLKLYTAQVKKARLIKIHLMPVLISSYRLPSQAHI